MSWRLTQRLVLRVVLWILTATLVIGPMVIYGLYLVGQPPAIALRPGWGWVIEQRWVLQAWATILLASGLILLIVNSVRWSEVPDRRRSVRTWLVTLLLGIGSLFAGCQSLLEGSISTELHELTDANGGRVVLIVRVDPLTSPIVFVGYEAASDHPMGHRYLRTPRAGHDLRPSLRPGRYLISGDYSVVGAVIDVNERTILADKVELPSLEQLRGEFGDDLWFSLPGVEGRPREDWR